MISKINARLYSGKWAGQVISSGKRWNKLPNVSGRCFRRGAGWIRWDEGRHVATIIMLCTRPGTRAYFLFFFLIRQGMRSQGLPCKGKFYGVID